MTSLLRDFSSVFEIAFALNAITYLLEIRPFAKTLEDRAMEAYDKVCAEIKAEGFGGPIMESIKLMAIDINRSRATIAARVTVANSIASVGLLIAGAFFSKLSLPVVVVAVILAWLLLTPLALYWRVLSDSGADLTPLLRKLFDEAKERSKAASTNKP
jgi:hypothetical protein